MGDSQYVIFRKLNDKFEDIFISEEILHEFNMPFQIGLNGDPPEKAQFISHTVYSGDLIVLATDGLWDNLDILSIKNITEKLLKEHKEQWLSKLAIRLAKTARKHSENKYASKIL